MRISEFCGLTLKDIDLEKKTVNIDHQLQRTSKREYVIEPTKTNAGTRVLPITDEVAEMFRSIIEDVLYLWYILTARLDQENTKGKVV